MFVNLVWPPKTDKHPSLLCILIQSINGKLIFSHSLAKLANMVQDKKADKHTPPSRGGLVLLFYQTVRTHVVRSVLADLCGFVLCIRSTSFYFVFYSSLLFCCVFQ